MAEINRTMIHIDCAWLVIQPLGMRAGSDTALARVVKFFGAAHRKHAANIG